MISVLGHYNSIHATRHVDKPAPVHVISSAAMCLMFEAGKSGKCWMTLSSVICNEQVEGPPWPLQLLPFPAAKQLLGPYTLHVVSPAETLPPCD